MKIEIIQLKQIKFLKTLENDQFYKSISLNFELSKIRNWNQLYFIRYI